ncbi:MAG TPA: putative LPS assembly protein LptD [Rubricoccaceae bacterium]
MPRVLVLLAALLVCAPAAGAQTVGRPPARPDSARADTVRADTARAVPLRGVPLRGVPLAPPAEGGLDEPVTYSARDSVRIEVADATADSTDDVVTLYGEAEARFRTATLTAGRLQYRARAQTLRAEPAGADTTGIPAFADGDQAFTGRLFTYNLTTRRGRVAGARTQIQDGFLLGGIIKQASPDIVYAQNAAYTTCELDHPHYALEAGRLMVVDGRRVYTGPVRLRLLGLAVPVALPFGYFPAAEGRRSGPLPLRYGRETGFGLFLDNVGWYWAVSDYFDATASAKIGTEGSFLARGQVRYNRLYAYQGSLSLEAGRLRQGEPTDPGYAPRIPLRLAWDHQQEFAAGPRLSARVDLQSVSQRLVADAVSAQITQQTSSSVTLQQTWPSVGRSLSLAAQASQDFVGNRTEVALPTASFTQQRLFPFRRGRDEGVFEKISVSYAATAANTVRFSPLTGANSTVSFFEALFDAEAFRTATGQPTRFDTRVEQRLPIQATYSVPRFNLTLTPTVSLTEIWASRSEQRTFLPDSNRVLVEQVAGFTTARRARAELTAATELFGTFGLRLGPIDGIRHTVRPSVSLAIEPDYSALGSVRTVQTDATGRTVRYSPISGIPTEPTRSLSFGIENAVLARIARTDTTGETTRRAVQILSLDVRGGVNFAAPERPVQDVTFNATSLIFGTNIRASAGYSAYGLDEAGNLTTDSYLSSDRRPLRLTSFSASVTRLFGRGSQASIGALPASASQRAVVAPDEAARREASRQRGEPYDPAVDARAPAVVGYTNAAAPISFGVDLTLGYRPAIGPVPAQTTAALTLSPVDLRLTPVWSLTGSTGLDLVTLDPTTTSLALRRDLHCWEMAIQWQPIGLTRGFSVSLYVKSGYLRDILRIDAPRNVVRSLPF